MPDITMCQDIGCRMRGICLRYLAYPYERQSYSYFTKFGCCDCEGLDGYRITDQKHRSVADVDAEILNKKRKC